MKKCRICIPFLFTPNLIHMGHVATSSLKPNHPSLSFPSPKTLLEIKVRSSSKQAQYISNENTQLGLQIPFSNKPTNAVVTQKPRSLIDPKEGFNFSSSSMELDTEGKSWKRRSFVALASLSVSNVDRETVMEDNSHDSKLVKAE